MSEKLVCLGSYVYTTDACPRSYGVFQGFTAAASREEAVSRFREHVRALSDFRSPWGILAEQVSDPWPYAMASGEGFPCAAPGEFVSALIEHGYRWVPCHPEERFLGDSSISIPSLVLRELARP